MKFYFASCFLAFALTPLSAEIFDKVALKEAIPHLEEMQQLYAEGKSVKAERAAERARIILKKIIKKNVRFSLPQNCSFRHHQYMYQVEFWCEDLKGITFQYAYPDKNILEALEECQADCIGDFVFQPVNESMSGELFTLGQFQGLTVKILFIKVKSAPKPESP